MGWSTSLWPRNENLQQDEFGSYPDQDQVIEVPSGDDLKSLLAFEVVLARNAVELAAENLAEAIRAERRHGGLVEGGL